eukprot:TRINITY_DN1137_c0_g2_i4.p1 TRINITY_DN1137_c0_g2~~TRINITY_DN1137_c0_g2_i4.p1  ORF type:complete len:545 (-),score=89.76 TRINITY_DN1137_c0_g2_i4:830-2464(-)
MSTHALQSLIQVTKQRIISMIRECDPGAFKIMLVDEWTTRILDAALKLNELVEENIASVDPIALSRQPLPGMEAIYFISPTPKSVESFIKDFSTPGRPLYKGAYLFFTSRVPDDVMAMIKSAPAVIPFVKSFKELGLSYLATESQAFTLGQQDGLQKMFSPAVNPKIPEYESTAMHIATVLRSLGETFQMPTIRCHSSGTSRSIGECLIQQLRTSIGKPGSQPEVPREPAVVLILDRSFDALTPVLHEFTYQAMIYDIIDLDKDIYKYKTTAENQMNAEREWILNEKFDPFWSNLRSMHIMDVISNIREGYEKFNASMPSSQSSEGGSETPEATRLAIERALHSLPQRREISRRYAAHISLSSDCMKAFSAQQISALASIEQDLATGEDATGNPIRNHLSSIMSLQGSSNFKEDSIMRLLMVHIITQGVKSTDRKLLFNTLHLPTSAICAFNNLNYLNVSTTKTAAKKGNKSYGQTKKKLTDDVPYELSRYVPPLKYIMDDLASDSLNATDFPVLHASKGLVSDSGKGAKGLSWTSSSQVCARQ